MDDLAGRVAVITGGASGIGLAMAEAFAASGMHIVLADIELDALEAATQQVGAHGGEVHAVPTDVTDPTAVDHLAEQATDRFGAVHVVCNNAGVGGLGGYSWDIPMSGWRWVLEVNLWGVIHGIRSFLPKLVAQGEGHVVNTASAAGYAALPFMSPYTATKHAVLAISEGMHHELAMTAPGVGVTVVCPGFVRTQIATSDRNWPAERLGPMPDASDNTIQSVMQALVDGGVDPSVLAAQVVEAVRDRRFLVTTDEPLLRTAAESRLRLIDGESPVMPPLG
jgi:NAD(P)-dependent dehydrogenase (short-subunit alcohol dehydrogenase family)